MSKFTKKKVMPRYIIVAGLLTMVGVVVLAKAAYTMTADKDWWAEVAKMQMVTADSIKSPNRGNILSCDGQLLAGSIPEYELKIDFRAGLQKDGTEDTAWVRERNELWKEKMDSICEGLHVIFHDKSAEYFREHLTEGMKKQSRYWSIVKGKVDFVTYNEVKKLPIFRLPRHKGGFRGIEYPARRHPFGSLAERTIGSRDTARYGIELAYDSLLTGIHGIAHLQKVRNKMVYVTTTPPVDGADIVTTIDIGMQDIAEQALLKELKEHGHLLGLAILMEVKTGDVKAIVNMGQDKNSGDYFEFLNYGLGYRCEPGSVFKTASILVALDDGVVDSSYVINTGSGIMAMHGAKMKDHNWHRGGYGSINVARSLEVSSNIGVSYVIDHFYGQNPSKYVDGLYRVGIGQDLKIPLSEYRAPKIRYPNTQTSVRGEYWSKTTLPWMSIGYETQIAPINTLAFYNAIANDGCLVQPRFVKRIVKGDNVEELDPVVLNPQIARPEAIRTMQTILTHVVSQGLGKRAGNKSFPVAGKTGTAQVSDLEYNYHSGVRCHWLSFCGFFPADNPRYSCIVCVKTTKEPASGGKVAGGVFHDIAEGVMANDVRKEASSARTASSLFVPDVKTGDMQAAGRVLSALGITTTGDWMTGNDGNSPVWGQALTTESGVTLNKTASNAGVMPSVIGMGARDAVYMLERLGVKVTISGSGHVRQQSLPAGTALQSGMACRLQLG